MNIITILLIILFFSLLFYYIYLNQNKIISYQTIKQQNEIDFNLNDLNKKYHRSNCRDYCSENLCNNYDIDLVNYKKCLNCQKKFSCYNGYTDKCDFCLSMGIGQCKLPINPKNNFCK